MAGHPSDLARGRFLFAWATSERDSLGRGCLSRQGHASRHGGDVETEVRGTGCGRAEQASHRSARRQHHREKEAETPNSSGRAQSESERPYLE